MLDSSKIAGIVLLVLAVGAGPTLAGSWASEVVLETSFDAVPGGRLAVDLRDADLEVRTGSGSQVRIEITLASNDLERARAIYRKIDVRAAGDGNGVTLESHGSNRGFDWRGSGGYSIRAQIEMPEEYDLDLRTADGDIDVGRVRGEVVLATADGDVRLDSAESDELTVATSDGDLSIGEIVASRIVMRTSDGDIQADSLDAGEIEVRTGDGDIALGAVSGALTATTSDGDIVLSIRRFGPTTVKTGDGDIVVRADAGLQADLALSGEEVSLGRDLPFEGRLSDDRAEGPLNGGGPSLVAASRDGSVRLSVN